MTLAVNAQSSEVKTLALQWAVLDALMGGTPTMREGGVSWLPRWPAEETASYQARLHTATLFPAYQRTVGVMSGKPFAKALTLSDDANETISKWCEDVDLQGNNLHTFASDVFGESFYGLAGILVEYPRVGPAPNGVRTMAAVEAAGLRPYMVRVYHGQVLGWRVGQVQGRTLLTQLRIREDSTVDDGDYGTKAVERVRVLTPGAWELWEKRSTGDGAWFLADRGTTSLGVIPFVPVYGRRMGYMDGRPPLLDLAYLNVKHWQSQSDQDTILHAARVPILAVRGVQDGFQLSIGGGQAVNLGTDPNAELKWVEHTGASIAAGKESLADLENQMIQTGAELLVKTAGDRSATESAGDQEANKCDLQRLTEQMEDALDQALVLMAQYGNVPPESAGSVSLFKDFGAATLSDASAQLVADLNSRGLLTKATTLREMQRRGVIEASVDVEKEIDAAEDEGPALGELTVPGMTPGAPGGIDPVE